MARPPLLRSQLLQYRRLMLLHPQVLFPAHCYHAVLSAHKSLRIPPDMTQEVSCRSLKRSRSSHSLSSFSAAESQLLLPSRLDHKFPSHFSMLLCRRLHLVTSPRRCLRRRLIHWTRFCVMWPFKRLSMVPTLSLDAAAQTTSPSTLSQHVSTQMGSRSAYSFSVDASMQTSTHGLVQLNAATQLDLTEFLIGWIFSDSPIDRRHPFCQSPPSLLGAHVAPLPPPGLEQPAPSPVIATQSRSLTNASSSHCPTLQQTASTTHVGTHPVRPAGAKRSASTAYAGTHNSNGPCPCTGVAPFSKHNTVIPMINFGHSKTSGPSPIATADSDIMHHQFRLSLLQWNPGPGAETLPILSPLPVVNSMQLSSRKPVTMSRTYLPISLRTLTTRTLPFCSTRTPLCQALLLSRLRSTLRAKILGAWCCSLSVPCFVVLLFLDHLQSHFALHISTMLWPRNVTLPPNFSNSFTPKCWSTRLIS